MDLAAGTLVDGKYRVVRPIGRGGMGAVYEVENVRIRKSVAMKLLSANAAEDVVRRFEKEAQAAGQIGSEHIVEVHDLGTMPSGEPYMVMELLEGETLRQRLHREKRISAEAAVPILVQILEGLSAAHAAGIVHRDLKPENIYLCSQRGGLRDWVKVLDFGISKFASVSEDGMTKTGQVIGTPQYMAPEQIKAPQTVDGRTDLYAVGVIFYQLLTGHIPFKAKTYAELLFKVVYEPLPHPTTFVPDLDREACEIIITAMNRDPAGRFPNAAAFRDRLVQLGTRLGSAGGAPTDPMRAFLSATNANLPRANVGGEGGVPPPTPSRPHGAPPSFGSSTNGPFGATGPQHPPPFATPGVGHATPGTQQHPSVPGGAPWPTGPSWPSGAGHAPPNGVAGSSPHHPQPFGPQAFGPPHLLAEATEDGQNSFQAQAATQMFPMSSSSPSHPSLSGSLSMSSAMAQRAGYGSAMTVPGGAVVPTPNPSFGGVPLHEPTHTLATSGGRKTAVAVAAAVFAVGLGATAFVVTRGGATSTGSDGSHIEPTTQPAEPAAPPPIETAATTPEVPPVPTVLAEPATSASTTPSASPGTPPQPKGPVGPGPVGPKPPPKKKNDFGY